MMKKSIGFRGGDALKDLNIGMSDFFNDDNTVSLTRSLVVFDTCQYSFYLEAPGILYNMDFI
jgi:hypothetical protein